MRAITEANTTTHDESNIMSDRMEHHDLAFNDDRLLARSEVERIVATIGRLAPDAIESTQIQIMGWWNGELRWARNRVSLASDRRDVRISIFRNANGGQAAGVTNQTDDESLLGALRVAERSAMLNARGDEKRMSVRPPVLPEPNAQIWSDATYNLAVETRGEVVRKLTESSEAHQLLSAGFIEMRGAAQAYVDPQGPTPGKIAYTQLTQSQCSITVRHPKGVGSGWAGLSTYNWTAIDPGSLAQRALDKCLASVNPVAIEPGRYTVILEPQAVEALIRPLVIGADSVQNRASAEKMGRGPFYLDYDPSIQMYRSKLGLKIIDDRITIGHDPEDSLLGVPPSGGLTSVNWIEKGILVAMGYDRSFSVRELNDNLPVSARSGYRMSGGETTMDEMIATTKRGIIVTRFSTITGLDPDSLLCTGYTRDGLWLVENGKISKAVKNFRFTESPLFMLNQVEQLGPPVPVFVPVKDPYMFDLSPAIVPPIKSRDFSFTAMIDAV